MIFVAMKLFYKQQHTAWYAAFEVFTAHKSSSTHIRFLSNTI